MDNMSTEDVLRRAAEEYLSTRPYVLWGDWDLTNTTSRVKAVDWLVEQTLEVARVAETIKKRKKK